MQEHGKCRVVVGAWGSLFCLDIWTAYERLQSLDMFHFWKNTRAGDDCRRQWWRLCLLLRPNHLPNNPFLLEQLFREDGILGREPVLWTGHQCGFNWGVLEYLPGEKHRIRELCGLVLLAWGGVLHIPGYGQGHGDRGRSRKFHIRLIF